ncbi:MAG: transposase [Desulforhopalus sp.]
MYRTEPRSAENPVSSERACIAYLFGKRWPAGFICPFCGRLQRDMAPAYTVVCRFCRKQTSITAHTVMHGSKKNLTGWMRVAWLFCSAEGGLSARKLQRTMALSSYHTAWKWLTKLRQGAALAETAPCRGAVLLLETNLPVASPVANTTVRVIVAVETDNPAGSNRLRLGVTAPAGSGTEPKCLEKLVAAGARVLTEHFLPEVEGWARSGYLLDKPDRRLLQDGKKLCRNLGRWLRASYRGAVDARYLQSYLDEFTFRHNSSVFGDPLAILDHLLSGLVKPVRRPRDTKRDWGRMS